MLRPDRVDRRRSRAPLSVRDRLEGGPEAGLTELALQQGFRGINTAKQRRHYHEAAVGQAIAATVARGLVAREDLFLQTKFTFRPGLDDRLPFDPGVPIPTQVEQSFASSLKHLPLQVVASENLLDLVDDTGSSSAGLLASPVMSFAPKPL